MANAITLAQQFVPLLDETYKLASCSSVLDGAPELARQGANANELIIPKISMQGLADYSRNGGYVSGDVTLTNETVKCNFDRGRKFTVDAMDDMETAGIAFGRLAGEFIRNKVAPELDAFRFATYAGISGISKVSAAAFGSGEVLMQAIMAGCVKMDEDEVPTDQRYLFITPTLYGLIQNMKSYESKAALDDFAQVVKVPQNRFYTAIKQLNGTSGGEEAGGYIKDSTSGKNINFMIIHKPAVIQFEKHVVPKIISPEANPDSDGYIFGYRNVSIADAYDNKVAGIYMHYSES